MKLAPERRARRFHSHLIGKCLLAALLLIGLAADTDAQDPRTAASHSAKERRGEEVELEFCGYISLNASLEAEDAPSFGRVRNFEIDKQGNIGFVSPNPDGSIRFVRVDPEGEILSNFDLALPNFGSDNIPMIAQVSEDRWVVVFSSWYTKPYTRAWWLAPSIEELTAIPGVYPGLLVAIDATEDGGFVTAACTREWNGSSSLIQRYDHSGNIVWTESVAELGTWDHLRLLDVSWLDEGGVVALSRGYEALLVYVDADGEYQRNIPVTSVIEKDLHWPTGVSWDVDGGFVFVDMGDPSVFRINREEKVVAKFIPSFTDNRYLSRIYDVQVAPNGKPWFSDTHAVLRLDDNGVVDKVIGRDFGDDHLISARDLQVGLDGLIYVANRKTGAIHVYDKNAALIRRITPAWDVEEEVYISGLIGVDEGGAILVQASNFKHYRFAGDTGPEEVLLAVKSAEAKRLMKPRSTGYWVVKHDEIILVGESGAPIKRIQNRPNGEALGITIASTVAKDGALAVLVGEAGRASKRPITLCLYDPNGVPWKSIKLRYEREHTGLALSSKYALTIDKNVVRFYDRETDIKKFWRIPVESKSQGTSLMVLSPDGTELWTRAYDSVILHRYKMPE
ncbi:MAG: hypothetical protein ACI8TQ_000773 [Planctomycetota bacterium]|jgi:hypothetical protein